MPQILAMGIGAVPFLKKLIFTNDAPLFFFTDSCIILGYVYLQLHRKTIAFRFRVAVPIDACLLFLFIASLLLCVEQLLAMLASCGQAY